MTRRARATFFRRALSLGLGLALTVGAVLGGRQYVFCAPMQVAPAHCCCPPRAPEAPTSIGVLCCDDRATPSLPWASTASLDRTAIPPAALAAVLPLEHLLGCDALDPSLAPHMDPSSRAGPVPRVHALASVYLI